MRGGRSSAGRGRRSPATLIAALFIVGSLAVATPAAADPSPWVQASVSGDFMYGCNFAPIASATVTVKDSPGGAQLLNTDVPTDGEGCFDFDPGQYGVDLAPGVFISVTDGSSTKELTLVPLSVDLVDPANDIVTGTASPSTAVTVSVDDYDAFHEELVVTSDGSGDWVADFGAIAVDITPFLHGGAQIFDGDGDATTAQRDPARVDGDITLDAVEGCGFVSNGSVTVTIKDAPGGTQLFSGPASTDGDCFSIGRDQHGQGLAPGMFVSATDGIRSKDVTLVSVSVDDIDAVAETAAGTAPANADVDVGAEVQDGSSDASIHVTADGAGAWAADFSGVFDLTAGVTVSGTVHDGDGDGTVASRRVPSIRADLSSEEIGGDGFTPNSSVTVTVKDAPGGTVLFSGEFPTGGVNGFFGNGGFILFGQQHGQHLGPGMVVSATDGTHSDELTIAALAITAVDPGADKVTGTAAPGAQVVVRAESPTRGATKTVTADGTGAWTAKFAGLVDIVNGSAAHAEIRDLEGDTTNAAALAPSINGSLPSDLVDGCGFGPGDPVTVTIRTAFGGTTLFSGATPADGLGCFSMSRAVHGQDLVTGRFVRATDGVVARSTTLATLTATFDFATDLISGTAPPGAEVEVGFSLPERGDGMTVTADGGGAWTADFGDQLNPGAHFEVRVRDGVGNSTVVDRTPATIEAHLGTDEVNGCGFLASSSATATIRSSPGGSTLFSGPVPTDADGCFALGEPTHGQDLVPGMFVDVTQGAVSVDHTLVAITVDSLDQANDRVIGTAPPDAVFLGVHVEDSGGGADVVTPVNDSGSWVANFGVGFDVTAATTVEASVTDEEFDEDVTVAELAPPACYLDGTTLNVGAGAVTLHRSGSSFDVTGAGITDPTCGGATMTNVDTVLVGGDAGAQSLTIDLGGGPLGPGATAEGSGTSEIEIIAALGPEDSLTVNGGAGADTVAVGASGVNLNGDNDADVKPAVPATPAFSAITVNGNAGNDTISATGGSGTGPAYPSAITLNGGADADALTGSAGPDSLAGGDGDDQLTGGTGANTVAGGTGADRLVEAGDVNFTLTNALLTFGPSTDALSGIELATLTGGAGANTLNGFGFGGQESLFGQAGTDVLIGGGGADTLAGGDGDDRLSGAGGVNTLSGGAGSDVVAESGDVNFNLSNTNLTFGSAVDSLAGVERAMLTGGAGANTLTAPGFSGAATLNGMGGADLLIGGNGADTLIGGDGADTLTGGRGANTVNGGAGNDQLSETGDVNFTLSNAALTFGSASDALSGVERAALTGGGGDNTIDGSAFGGMLTLNGQGGSDRLIGGPAPDALSGGGGADVLAGRQGSNTISGGAGSDTVVYDWSGAGVRVNLSTGSASGSAFSDLLSAIENAVGSAFADALTGAGGPNALRGLAGNDTIDVRDGVRGNDMADGGAGTDRCLSDPGDARISCES